MSFIQNTSESYWNSFRLLEKQLLRLSYSICFNDEQIDIYSSELADIISSACIKIESLAKDIYEKHIYPFQIDNGTIPISLSNGKNISKFKSNKWTRDKWKYDYNCLVEIDQKYSLRKKRVHLKRQFEFSQYGNSLFPFYGISLDDCRGGKWEYINNDIWKFDSDKLIDVDWCKSYQNIKHNYIQSIPNHGTVKNAIMVLAAFYLLAIYNSCLPARCFNWNRYSNNQMDIDFNSELFACEISNYTIPSFIIDSDHPQISTIIKKAKDDTEYKRIYEEQLFLNNVDTAPFLVILNESTYQHVKKKVDAYCSKRNLNYFDIAPYQRKNYVQSMSEEDILYNELKKYIFPLYHSNNICIAFNNGLENVYSNYYVDFFDYEKSKFLTRTKEVLLSLKVGDFVDAKFLFNDLVSNAEVKKINESVIELYIHDHEKSYILSEHLDNLIFIRFSSK